jgi:ribosomal protein S6
MRDAFGGRWVCFRAIWVGRAAIAGTTRRFFEMNKLYRYEALFVLNTAGKDEGVPEILNHIEAEIKAIGGKVDSVQKMDRRPFVRPSHRQTSGYYANVIFHGPHDAVVRLTARFRLDEKVFRVMFLRRDEPKPKKERKEKTAEKGAVKARG